MRKRAIRSLVVMMIAVMVVAMMPVSVSAASKKPAQVKITSLSVGKVSTKTNKCTVTIKWKKAKNATGYIVYAKHGTGKWIKQKKCGKNIRIFKLTKVPAGQLQIKVKAINKKKSGKFSKVKKKFIKSPMTLEQYINRCDPESQNYYYGGGTTLKFGGNTAFFNTDLDEMIASDPDLYGVDLDSWSDYAKAEYKTSIYNNLDDMKKDAADIKKDYKLNHGILNVKVVFRYFHHGEVWVSRTF